MDDKKNEDLEKKDIKNVESDIAHDETENVNIDESEQANEKLSESKTPPLPVEKNTLDKDKEIVEEVQKQNKLKNIPIKKIVVGICAVFGVFILIVAFNGIKDALAKPLELTKNAEYNSVSIKYPGEWKMSESTRDGDRTFVYSEADKAILVMSAYNLSNNIEESSDSSKINFAETVIKNQMITISNSIESSDVDNHPCYYAEGTFYVNQSNYTGYIKCIYTETNVNYILCGYTEKGGATYRKTIDAMKDTIHISKAKTVNVTFMDDKEEVATVKGSDYGIGTSVKAPKMEDKEGLAFAGWQLDKVDNSIKINGSGNEYTIEGIKKDVTLIAQWTKTYKVTFTDGSGNVIDEQIVLEGKSAVEPTDPTKDKNEFVGWDKEFDNITSDLTVNAKWIHIWTVTFEDGSGNVLKTQEVKDGESASAPSDPTNSEKDFDGWDKGFSKVTSDLTVKAKWIPKPTLSQKNALASALSYLRHMPFSRSGLIEQLEFEGYSKEDATYGVDHAGADWNEQAVKQAESYLDIMPFSRDGLIEQLMFEGFSYDQAVYGVNGVGL